MKKIGEFKDLGVTRTVGLDAPSVEPKKTVKEYSRTTFDASDFPELSKKPVGSECVIVMKVKKVGERQPDAWDLKSGRKGNRIELEMISAAEPIEAKQEKGGTLEEVVGKSY